MFFFFLVLSLLNSNLFQLATYTEYKKNSRQATNSKQTDHGALIDLLFQRQYQHLDEWKRLWQTVGIKGGGSETVASRALYRYVLSFFLPCFTIVKCEFTSTSYIYGIRKKEKTDDDASTHVKQPPFVMAEGDTAPSTPAPPSSNSSSGWSSQFLHFPPIFGAGFGPSALLYAAPTLTNPMNYGEGFDPSGANDSFSISRPTIELPFDEILFGDESTGWVILCCKLY